QGWMENERRHGRKPPNAINRVGGSTRWLDGCVACAWRERQSLNAERRGATWAAASRSSGQPRVRSSRNRPLKKRVGRDWVCVYRLSVPRLVELARRAGLGQTTLLGPFDLHDHTVLHQHDDVAEAQAAECIADLVDRQLLPVIDRDRR